MLCFNTNVYFQPTIFSKRRKKIVLQIFLAPPRLFIHLAFYKPKFPTLLPQYSDFRKCDDKVNGVAMHYSFPLDISNFLASNTGCPLCPAGQDLSAILSNTGFIKYCVFSKISNIFRSLLASLGFPSVSVCVHNGRSNTSTAAELSELRNITTF